MIVTLTKEITVGGEKVKELNIRAPEYDEIAKFGMPFSYSDNGSAKIDMSCTLA
ncbi:TPA: phage tail assembly protein, partial [Yersinia enterocolitica]|nr:phage tail assembly protein [Yersinia enterocolitica]